MKVGEIAKICHELHRNFCESVGDTVHPPWDELSINDKQSAKSRVYFFIDNPDYIIPDNVSDTIQIRDGLYKAQVKCLIDEGLIDG